MRVIGRRFERGAVVATPGALELLARHGKEPGEYLARHLSGDWGPLRVRPPRERAGAQDGGAAVQLLRCERREGLGHHRGRPLLDVPAAPGGVLALADPITECRAASAAR